MKINNKKKQGVQALQENTTNAKKDDKKLTEIDDKLK